MSESENIDAGEQENKPDNNPKKRVRHRKRQLYENIMKQMEFYFSDANLSKDRFLGDLVKSDPFVALSEFLKFNKIRSLTQDVNDIVKSIKHSTFLELSDDKLKVKRKIPLLPYDADQRTIYVESIPVTASREWLERVFSDYGQVAYISLPKFKNSQNIKGFAFIEFNQPQDANNCLNVFTKMGCRLPSQMPPEDLSSIKMFNIDTIEDLASIADVKDEFEPPKKKAKKVKEKKPSKGLDLKPEGESDTEKLDTPTDENKTITTPVEEGKTVEAEFKDGMACPGDTKDLEDTPRKKRGKKRPCKEKVKLNILGKGEAPKGALWGLQVLAKSEWKALRNKYLNLQRKYMKDIKMNLQKKRHAYSEIPAPAAPPVEVGTANPTQDTINTKSLEPLEKIPGVFVQEVLAEPCLDVRVTKRTIKSNIHVLHVEVKEGQREVIIRFDSAKAAADYSSSVECARVLCGADEQEQWRRAEAARSVKRSRGRDRLLARALPAAAPALLPASPTPTHTHIRFDDE